MYAVAKNLQFYLILGITSFVKTRVTISQVGPFQANFIIKSQ